MISSVKAFLFGKDAVSKSILFGKASGIRMIIDPLHKSQRLLGMDEKEIAAHFVNFSMLSDVLVDIGSSDGYYGLIYKKYNPEGVIISCDFNRDFLPLQKLNYSDNRFQTSENFLFVDKMISDQENVETTTVDKLLAWRKFESPLIKVDVDGGELHVLHGALQSLNALDCRLIVETHSQRLEDSCISFLSSVNYTIRIVSNAWWRAILPEKRLLPHNRWFLAFKEQ